MTQMTTMADGARMIDLVSHRLHRQNPLMSQVFDYWQSLRKGDALISNTDPDFTGHVLDRAITDDFRVLFQELAKRISHIEVAGPHQLIRSNFVGGLKELPVTISLA